MTMDTRQRNCDEAVAETVASLIIEGYIPNKNLPLISNVLGEEVTTMVVNRL